MSIDLTELNNTYKDKWINEFGNVSNSNLESMWSDIFQTLNSVESRNAIRRRGIKDTPFTTPLNVVYSATMGSGKTTTVQHYLQYGLNTQFYKALVVVELIETCDEYECILKDKGAVAIHSGNGRTLEGNLEASILIITHNRLISLLNKGLADEVFNEYDLVVIDEEVSTYQHISFSYKDILRNVEGILKSYYVYGGKIKKLFERIKYIMEKYKDKTKSDFVLPIFKYTNNRKHILDWVNIVEEFNSILNSNVKFTEIERKILTTTRNKIQALSRQGRMKLVWIQQDKGTISFNVVIDNLPIHVSKVIFDGTASINDTYKLLNKHLGADTVEIRKYHNVRSFKNASIMYYSSATGKSRLTVSSLKGAKKYNKEVSDVKASLINLVNKTIRRYTKDERVLFIIHKNNVEYLVPLLVGTNYTFTYWGKHVGSNAWSGYNKIVIYGLNYLPEPVYRAKYYSTLGINTNLDIDSIEGFKAGLISSDIMQGIFRGGLRNVIDDNSNCSKECEVIITLPNSILKSEILDRMKCILHDSTFTEIKDGAIPVNSDNVNTTKIKKLIAVLNKAKSKVEKPYIYTKSSFIEKLHFTPREIGYEANKLRDLLLRGKHKDINNQLLQENNWSYIKPTAEDRTECTNIGKARYLFKHIGEFKSEVPVVTYDVNGMEF